MSEFVECQNCGRTFFAENIDCPYCRDQQETWEREHEDGHHEAFGIHRLLFAGFGVALVVTAGVALGSLRRTPFGPGSLLLASEAMLSVLCLIGLWQRRRWARRLAIAFILANAVLGIVGMLDRGQARWLAWGPGPLALLLFLVPFFSPQAREHFRR